MSKLGAQHYLFFLNQKSSLLASVSTARSWSESQPISCIDCFSYTYLASSPLGMTDGQGRGNTSIYAECPLKSAKKNGWRGKAGCVFRQEFHQVCQEQDKCVLWAGLWDVHLIFQGHFLRWHEAHPGAFTTPTPL